MQIESSIEAILKLENGLEFQGYSFGYVAPTDGEVVFSTAMVGYPESLT
ncbi:MAG: carbamoyl-phosphate synthase domain-containing protein, partial [Bacteroidales bacterium]